MLLLLPLGVNAQKNARIDKIELHLTFGIIMTEYSIPCKDYHTNFQSDIDTFTIVQKDSVQRIVEMIRRTAGISNYKKNMNSVNTRGMVYLWDNNTIIDSMCLGSPIGYGRGVGMFKGKVYELDKSFGDYLAELNK